MTPSGLGPRKNPPQHGLGGLGGKLWLKSAL
jgi:hypothetical protein